MKYAVMALSLLFASTLAAQRARAAQDNVFMRPIVLDYSWFTEEDAVCVDYSNGVTYGSEVSRHREFETYSSGVTVLLSCDREVYCDVPSPCYAADHPELLSCDAGSGGPGDPLQP